ncbi:MAG: VWA-like domain-containing protein [Monoglobaceae bacterium]
MDSAVISRKLSNARLGLLKEYPFFGRLLLHLRFGLSECGTAFTDMQRIVFDPEFASRLTDEEIKYVLVHEVLHCSLKHCTRGAGKQHFIYNVACDIVVNSTMLEMFEKKAIYIDGTAVMHTAPDGSEGRTKSAEEIYLMLMKMSPVDFENMYMGGGFDNHSAWEGLDNATLEDLWNHHLREAAAACGVGSGIPSFMARYLKEVDHSPRTNWYQILHDFIQYDRSDYDFSKPDKRYSADVILPSFCDDMDKGKIENLWFLIDTSGSVSDDAIAEAYYEIRQATAQIGNLSGIISFFDCSVSEPIAFESIDDLIDIKPIGGGGTSFHAIFKKLAELNEQDELPALMVIITDGFAAFPDEEAALGVPVIWIIVDSEVKPPWGTYAYIST